MRVATTAVDGAQHLHADLTRDHEGQLWLDGQPVLAVSAWGSRVGLTLIARIVLIDSDDYWRFLRSAAPKTSA